VKDLFQEIHRVAGRSDSGNLFGYIARRLSESGLAPSVRPWAGSEGVLVCPLRSGTRSRLVLDAQLPQHSPGLPEPEVRDHALVGSRVLVGFPHLSMCLAAFLDLARLPEIARPAATLLVWSHSNSTEVSPATARDLLGLSGEGLVLGPSKALPFHLGRNTVIPVDISVHGRVRITHRSGGAAELRQQLGNIDWPSAALVAESLDPLLAIQEPHRRALGRLARRAGMERRVLFSILQSLAPDVLEHWRPAGAGRESRENRLFEWPLGSSLDDLRYRLAGPTRDRATATVEALWSPAFLSPSHPSVRMVMDRLRVLEPDAVPVPLWRGHHPRPCWYQSMAMSWLGLTPLLFPSSLNGNAMLREPVQRCPISGLEWGRRTLVDLVTKLAG
jgi:hypothetical protein